MGRKEEFYILLGLLLAVLSFGVGWLALPQTQAQLGGWATNTLFVPLVGVCALVVLLLFLLLRDWIIARLRALSPKRRIETQYLHAVAQSFSKTPALLAASELADLLLLEAYSPLTLRPDRDEARMGGSTAPPADEIPVMQRQAVIRTAGGKRVMRGIARSEQQGERGIGAQVSYWGIWAAAQAVLLAIALAGIVWLLWSPISGLQFDWWRIALALVVGVGWFLAARWLHGWLAADDDKLADLLTWWRQRSECTADDGTPGAEIWAHTQLLIRGHPGCGKTTLMRHMAVICARERQGLRRDQRNTSVRSIYGWPTCPFPIYIPLRALNLSNRNASLLDAYAQKLPLLLTDEHARYDTNFFTRRLAHGGCLVLLDAFDELRDPTARRHVARLIAQLPPGPAQRRNRFVVTSRIVGYEGQLDGDTFVHRWIEDLDADQSASFIRARYAAIAASERRALAQELSWQPVRQAENLIRRLPNNPGLRRLSRNPLLLALTVSLHHDHRGKGLQLPEERYRLYDEALRLLVRDWERRKDADNNLEPTDDRSDLNLDERLLLLRELAWMMFEQSADGVDARAHAVVRGSHARAKLAEVLVQIPGFAPEKTGDARIAHANSEAERWMQNISQRGGVLQELGNVPGSTDVEVQFAHLTFQEYLAARAAASADTERRLARILERWDRPAWREVLLLYAASHNATPVMRHVLAQPGIDSILLAGSVLLERPVSLDLHVQTQTLERLRALAFSDAAASEQQALAALEQLEERAALPEPAALLHAFAAAPHGPVRARALELGLGRPLIMSQRDEDRDRAPLFAPPADLVPTLLHAVEHDQHYLPRVAAGYALAADDPRYHGEAWCPAMVHVPAGPFLMGSSETDEQADWDEKPQHQLELPDFWIGKFPVTVAQWRCFVADQGYTTRAFWTKAGWQFINRQDSGRPWYTRLLPNRTTNRVPAPALWNGPETGDDNLPVTRISWFEAVAYCRWLSARTGDDYRLPTEAEWEKAARGPEGLIWPWGDTWQPEHCNSNELNLGRTSPVGSFPASASPYGALDMAGNVYEWCATRYGEKYPYQLADEWQEDYLEIHTARRIRGGGYRASRTGVRGAYRLIDDPRDRLVNIGLRVASHSLRTDPVS